MGTVPPSFLGGTVELLFFFYKYYSLKITDIMNDVVFLFLYLFYAIAQSRISLFVCLLY